jgi:hypothetical protein
MIKQQSPVRLYRELENGEQFCIFGDPAESQDYCAAVAVSKKHYDFPLVFNQIMESSQFGYELFYMAKYIQKRTGLWPRMAVERNTGAATIYVLKTLNYPDLFRMVDFTSINSAEKGEIGWVTSGSLSGGELQGTRRKMLDDLSLAINQGMVKMYDEEHIRQLKSFMYVKGRAQARSNKKDDLVMACLSQDTEVLTENGWKLIIDVQIGEKVPSLNLETNKVELAINRQTINSPYSGKMIHFKGRGTDFLVTPNHRMVVHKSNGQNMYTETTIERADALLGKHFRLHKDAEWSGEGKNKWIIPKYKPSKFHKEKTTLKYNINDFLLFLGLYISEGSGTNERLRISQTIKGKAYSFIPELLDRMKIKYALYKDDFTINNAQIARYIKKLVPGYAHEKRIPREILNLSQKNLYSLYYGMMLGDGCNDRIYTTNSRGLCDDFLELINKLGWTGTWHEYDNRNRKIFDGRATVQHTEYYISISRTHIRPRFNHHNKDDVKAIDFEGRQVCLSLDKNGVMLVRRSGTMMWTGNTAGAWQIQLLTPELEFDERSDELIRKEKEKWRFK